MGAVVSGIGMGLQAKEQERAAAEEQMKAETSKILEAAFFDDEVSGIIAESARLVGGAEAEAGARGVKSTTGTAAARTAEIRRAGRRDLHTAAQESVITRHGFSQKGLSAQRKGKAAIIQGALGIAGQGMSTAASMYSQFSGKGGSMGVIGMLG